MKDQLLVEMEFIEMTPSDGYNPGQPGSKSFTSKNEQSLEHILVIYYSRILWLTVNDKPDEWIKRSIIFTW